jgi:hypothetical protein
MLPMRIVAADDSLNFALAATDNKKLTSRQSSKRKPRGQLINRNACIVNAFIR